jgi:GntR family transcriptional regulator
VLLRVDTRSRVPLFQQIVFEVKAQLARGEIAAGDRLPSVRELARELTINPNTVVRAYELLESEGVIVRRQGAGCFVTGRESTLAAEQRSARLDELVQQLVIEAHHLGFEPDAVRRALERTLGATVARERQV